MDSRHDVTVGYELQAAAETGQIPAVPATADAGDHTPTWRRTLAVTIALVAAFLAVALVSLGGVRAEARTALAPSAGAPDQEAAVFLRTPPPGASRSSSSAKWHATWVPSSTVLSSGSSRRQISCANGQRGLKLHPGGGSEGSATSPRNGSWTSRLRRLGSASGTESSSARV